MSNLPPEDSDFFAYSEQSQFPHIKQLSLNENPFQIDKDKQVVRLTGGNSHFLNIDGFIGSGGNHGEASSSEQVNTQGDQVVPKFELPLPTQTRNEVFQINALPDDPIQIETEGRPLSGLVQLMSTNQRQQAITSDGGAEYQDRQQKAVQSNPNPKKPVQKMRPFEYGRHPSSSKKSRGGSSKRGHLGTGSVGSSPGSRAQGDLLSVGSFGPTNFKGPASQEKGRRRRPSIPSRDRKQSSGSRKRVLSREGRQSTILGINTSVLNYRTQNDQQKQDSARALGVTRKSRKERRTDPSRKQKNLPSETCSQGTSVNQFTQGDLPSEKYKREGKLKEKLQMVVATASKLNITRSDAVPPSSSDIDPSRGESQQNYQFLNDVLEINNLSSAEDGKLIPPQVPIGEEPLNLPFQVHEQTPIPEEEIKSEKQEFQIDLDHLPGSMPNSKDSQVFDISSSSPAHAKVEDTQRSSLTKYIKPHIDNSGGEPQQVLSFGRKAQDRLIDFKVNPYKIKKSEESKLGDSGTLMGPYDDAVRQMPPPVTTAQTERLNLLIQQTSPIVKAADTTTVLHQEKERRGGHRALAIFRDWAEKLRLRAELRQVQAMTKDLAGIVRFQEAQHQIFENPGLSLESKVKSLMSLQASQTTSLEATAEKMPVSNLDLAQQVKDNLTQLHASISKQFNAHLQIYLNYAKEQERLQELQREVASYEAAVKTFERTHQDLRKREQELDLLKKSLRSSSFICHGEDKRARSLPSKYDGDGFSQRHQTLGNAVNTSGLSQAIGNFQSFDEARQKVSDTALPSLQKSFENTTIVQQRIPTLQQSSLSATKLIQQIRQNRAESLANPSSRPCHTLEHTHVQGSSEYQEDPEITLHKGLVPREPPSLLQSGPSDQRGAKLSPGKLELLTSQIENQEGQIQQLHEYVAQLRDELQRKDEEVVHQPEIAAEIIVREKPELEFAPPQGSIMSTIQESSQLYIDSTRLPSAAMRQIDEPMPPQQEVPDQTQFHLQECYSHIHRLTQQVSQLQNQVNQRTSSFPQALFAEDPRHRSVNSPQSRRSDPFINTVVGADAPETQPRLTVRHDGPPPFQPLNTEEDNVDFDYIKKVHRVPRSKSAQLFPVASSRSSQEVGSSFGTQLHSFQPPTARDGSSLGYHTRQSSILVDDIPQQSAALRAPPLTHAQIRQGAHPDEVEKAMQAEMSQLKTHYCSTIAKLSQRHKQDRQELELIKIQLKQLKSLLQEKNDLIASQKEQVQILEGVQESLENEYMKEMDNLTEQNAQFKKLDASNREIIQDLKAELQQKTDELSDDRKQSVKLKARLSELGHSVERQEKLYEQKVQQLERELMGELKKASDQQARLREQSDHEKQKLTAILKDRDQALSQEKRIGSELRTELFAARQDFEKTRVELEEQVLAAKSDYLSLQIKMKEQAQAIEKDIEVRDKEAQQQALYLKNQINDLRLNQGGGILTTIGSETCERRPRDSEISAGSLEAYRSVVADALGKLQDQLADVSILVQSKTERLNFEAKMEAFKAFEREVLLSIVDWEQKVHTLEYRMKAAKSNQLRGFIKELKQVIVTKDALLKSARQQNSTYRALLQDLAKDRGLSPIDFKAQLSVLKPSQTALQTQVKLKAEETEQLKKFIDDLQSKVTASERRALAAERDLEETKAHNSHLLAGQREATAELSKLTQSLFGGDIPSLSCVKENVERIKEVNAKLTNEVRAKEVKLEELEKHLNSQRSLFKGQIERLEEEMDRRQKQWISQEDNLTRRFSQKEAEYEGEIRTLSVRLKKETQDFQFLERQNCKWEQKMTVEQDRIKDLDRQLQLMADEKADLVSKLKIQKDSFSALEQKLHQTQALLDHRLHMIDSLDEAAKRQVDENEELKRHHHDLETVCARLKTEHEDMRIAQLNEKTEKELLQIDKQRLTKELEEVQPRMKELEEQLEEAEAERQRAQTTCREKVSTEEQLFGEIKRYQDSVRYLTRELDQLEDQKNALEMAETKIASLSSQLNEVLFDKAAVEEELEKARTNFKEVERLKDLQRENIAILEEDITNLKDQLETKQQEAQDTVAQLHRKQSAVEFSFPAASQQSESSELSRVKAQKREYKHYVKKLLAEAKELRTIIRNQNQEINSLMGEKRQLEDQILRQPGEKFQTRASQFPVKQSESQRTANLSSSMLEEMHAEQGEYINKVELENSALRDEIERLKDQIILLEVEKLGTISASAEGGGRVGSSAGSFFDGGKRHRYLKGVVTTDDP